MWSLFSLFLIKLTGRWMGSCPQVFLQKDTERRGSLVNPPAAPAENSIFNLSVATEEVLLHKWKSGSGLFDAKCRGQFWCMFQAMGCLCSQYRGTCNCRGAGSCHGLTEWELPHTFLLLNCTVCAFLSSFRPSAVETESHVTPCAKSLVFIQCVTTTRSAVRQVLLN